MPPAAEAASPNGYWGIPTATIDWCEENYEVTTYIAEFWNTVTNLWMILPPIHGLYCVYKNKFEKRFFLLYLTLLTIGVGSWLFHMTLRYDMQLMDEVPMVFGSATLIYCIYQTRQPKGVLNAHLAFFLLAYCMTFLVVYLYIKEPLFHEWMYGVLVAVMVGLDLQLTLTQRSKVNDRMFIYGVLIYLIGFFLWNVDNLFCPTVKRVRYEVSPAALRPFTQLHGWWHACAGYATYIQIVTVIHHRQFFLGEKCDYQFSPLVGMTISRTAEQLEMLEARERLEKMKKME